MERLIIEPARAEERASALSLLFRDLRTDQAEEQSQRLLSLLQLGLIPEAFLAVARVSPGGPILGSSMAESLVGPVAQFYPPVVETVLDSSVIESLLVRFLLVRLHQQGVKLVQSFLQPHSPAAAARLTRNGITLLTRLLTLETAVPSQVDASGEPPVCLRSDTETDHDLFMQTLLATYSGTQDFPELNGLLSGEEYERVFRQVAADRNRWYFIEEIERQPLGVMIVGGTGARAELVYLGLLPAARGRGLARRSLRELMTKLVAEQIKTISLRVDARNEPALRLYRALGFTTVATQEVYTLRLA